MASPSSPSPPDPESAGPDPVARGEGPSVPDPVDFQVRPYRPARWLPGPHAQTLGARMLRPSDGPASRRVRWDTPDGDFVDLDLGGPDTGAEDAPRVLLLHGLEGSSRRGYIRLLARELHARGLRTVALNFRSCSGEPNRKPRFYHSGDSDEIRWVVDRLRAQDPDAPLGAAGVSMGGNILLRYLSEPGAGVEGAVAISVPFDLSAGTAELEGRTTGRLYMRYFLGSLMEKVRQKEELLRGRVDMERLRRARNLREFDDALTAPLHGFGDAETYYREASSGPVLHRVGTPTLLLQARDDPFQPSGLLPEEAVARNHHLVAAFPGRGGHVGFVEGSSPLRPRFWAEAEAARFLAHVLGRDSA
ncbi:MAG: alpha/beta fold hydrolase [Gemmatimonadales bacterium]|nr:MAG: alpha/beta fold hydrolase [Gemmatimonadales bacterium]